MFEDILTGISMMLEPTTIVLAFFGVVLGSVLGMIPGLTATMAIALLMPFTFSLNPVAAIVLLTAMYKGGIFGGSISAILLNTPGTSAAAATAIKGNLLAKKGQGGKAIKMAVTASLVGDLIGFICLILLAGFIAKFALAFGPPEYAGIILFSFTMVLGLSQKSLLKAVLAMSVGIFLASIGYDASTGEPRFSFGSMEMSSGIDLIPMLIGLLAVSEIFVQMENVIRGKSDTSGAMKGIGDTTLKMKEVLGVWKTLFRSGSIGTFIGALPGLGPTVAAFLGYNSAKKNTKNPKEFEEGSLEGVAGPEAANSAVGSSNLIPLISLGIPGDAEGALILGALIIQGITPGPQIFVNNGPIIYGIFAGLLIAAIMNFVFNWYFSRWSVKIRNIPIKILIPIILILSTAGAFGINQNVFDIKTMLVFGIIGYIMVKFKIPTTALLIGFILGPIFESSVRQSLVISDNSLAIFFQSPITLICIIITFITIASYIVKSRKQKEFN